MVTVEKNKVCVHSIYFEYSFVYEMLVDPDYIPGSISAKVTQIHTTSYKLEESIGCILKDDLAEGSVAQENDYDNIEVTTSPQNSLGLKIKQSGVWFIQKKCDDCCQILKTKKLTDLNHSQSNTTGPESITIGSASDPILNGNELKQWLYEGGYNGGLVGLKTFMAQLASSDPTLFAKILDCLAAQVGKFNKNGYLKGKNDESDLKNSLKGLSEKIDTYLSRRLTCNNSQAVCAGCVDFPTLDDVDPTYRSENEVFLESNYRNNASKVTPLGKEHAMLALEKNKSWVKN